jgi:ABC-type sugar transport system substrate-binding protein
MKRKGAYYLRRRRGKAIVLVAAAAAVTLLAGACSSSGTSGATGGGANGVIVAKSSTDTAKMKADGIAMAAKLGAQLPRSAQTVGIISVTQAAPIVARGTAGAQAAAKVLGWKVIVCDSGGLPAKMATCAQSLLAQGVTAMISNVIEPSLILPSLKLAKSKGIPWGNMLGETQPSPYYAAQTVENEKEISHAEDQFLLDQTPKVTTVAYDDYPPIAAVDARTAVFRQEMAAAGVKIVSHFITDESDFSKATGWAEGLLQQFPHLGAIWITQSPDGVPVANVIGAKYPGKHYPQRPLLVGLYAGLADMAQMRKGNLDGAVEVAAEAAGWEAMDQLGEIIGRHATPESAPNPADNYGYPYDFMAPFLVTPKTVPSNPNQYAPPPHNFVAFFTAKWSKEYKSS